MTKTQTVDLLKSQLPGFYSAEQVINLIEKMEDNSTITPDMLKEIENNIMENLRKDHDNGRLVCEDDIEVEIGSNRTIEFSNINIDVDVIRDAIAEGLEKLLPEYNHD